MFLVIYHRLLRVGKHKHMLSREDRHSDQREQQMACDVQGQLRAVQLGVTAFFKHNKSASR
jgi:hypothetical protein